MLEQAIKNISGPVRLHLGCGSVKLAGWINVDGEYMRNDPEVVIHDITTALPVADNSVDEILLVHVIEHINPRYVDGMIREWLRVLKPKGTLALEWPDLLKLCQYIVNNPSSLYSDDKRIKKRSVAGIYGDIARYKDSVMLHKWGYSEESMCRLLVNCGFKRAWAESNQYPKSEMDSRVVAEK
jgi:predicted SAM-dependent methyltransferase